VPRLRLRLVRALTTLPDRTGWGWSAAIACAYAIVAAAIGFPTGFLKLAPAAFAVFTSPVYLVLVALLGLACTLAYLRSASIWPPVFLHGLAVNVWVFLLGGRALLEAR